MALAFQAPNPWALLDRLAPGGLDWWAAYFEVEPLPDAWTQTAVVAQQVAMLGAQVAAIGGAKQIRLPKLSDFMPQPAGEKDDPDLTPEQEAEAKRKRIEREEAVWKAAAGIRSK